MTSQINKKSYNIIIRTTKQYILKIYSFATSQTLLMLVRIQTSIVSSTKLRIKAFATFLAASLQILSTTKIKGRTTSTISSTTLGITSVIHGIGKVLSTISTSLSITINSKKLMRTISTIHSGSLSMTMNAIVATLRKLSVFDPQTLATLDSGTLASMDHT